MTNDSPTTACETHLSRLFFSGDRVYKQLKAVKLPFVDFSDTDVRCAAATDEFEQNQGISPDVYLGLADVYEDGKMVDRMIVMRRLAEEDALVRLLNTGRNAELITLVARNIAAMHAGLPPLQGEQASPASATTIAQNWQDNFAAIQPFVGTVIDAGPFEQVQSLAETYIAGRGKLFQDRIDAGWIRQGHGDLRAEHVYCTPDGPRLIDCVAFDNQLRTSDVLTDVAFLAMDLDRLAGPQAATELMTAWAEFTNESHPSSLAHFYVAYRAHVRCKIACLAYEQGQPGAAQMAQHYHDLALRHLEFSEIKLVLVGGGPGTGKSTIAEGVARATGAIWLRSDEIRKDLAGMGHDQHAFAEPGEGIYSDDMSNRVHCELQRQTRMLLQSGASVVLDATWQSHNKRHDLRQIASSAAATTAELRCVIPAAVAKERIARRMASIYNPSDASPELVDYIAKHFDDWPEATCVDTSGDIATNIATACQTVSPVTEPAASPRDHSARFVLDISMLGDLALIRDAAEGL